MRIQILILGFKGLKDMQTDNCCNLYVPFYRRIVDDGVKENGFSIITENRTYHIIAENTNDWK